MKSKVLVFLIIFVKIILNKIAKKFAKVKNPKVSAISPIYNRERFSIRFFQSIQYQNIDNIEIIYVNKKSIDNGVKIL